MRRPLAAALVAVVVAASAGAGAAAFAAARQTGPSLPQISAYSLGETVRVGPFLYCDVLNLEDCAERGAQGALRVDEEHPVQLSVPAAVSRAPWRLIKVYADGRDDTTTAYRPGTRLAVTIPTVDPRRGRVLGIAVQLRTLVRDENDEVFDLPHAEWLVGLLWD